MPTELLLTVLWSGSVDGAEATVARFGTLGQATPVPNSPKTFLELQRLADERMAWGRRYYAKGGFFGEIDEAVITTIVERIATAPKAESEVYCLQLGGAVGDVEEAATPYAGRAAGHYWIANAVWDDPAEDGQCVAWGRETAARLAAHSLQVNYVNEQSDTGVAQSAYGAEKYKQLARLKWRYDPTNLFRLNQNIEPRPWSVPE